MTGSIVNIERFFGEAITRNIQHWLAWLQDHQGYAASPDEGQSIARAAEFAVSFVPAWPAVYDLLDRFTPYMDRWGFWTLWEPALAQGIETGERLGAGVKISNLAVTLALLYQRRNHFWEAARRYHQAIRRARQWRATFALARACTNLGYMYTELGYWWRAEILCCRALVLFSQLDNHYGWAHTENHLGLLYTRQGRWQLAEEHLARACAMWQEDGDDHGLLRGYINFSLLYLEQEEPEQALVYLNRARRQAEVSGDMALQGLIYMNLANAHRQLRKLAQAEHYHRQAEAVYEQQEDMYGLAKVWGNLGVLFTDYKYWSAAETYLTASLEQARLLGNKHSEIEALLDYMRYELARGRPDEAGRRLQVLEERVRQVLGTSPHNPYQARLVEYRRLVVALGRHQAVSDES